jgi:hypothetical protein
MPSDFAAGAGFVGVNAAVIASNLFVLVLIITQRILHTPTNAIVLSLTISDFLLGIFVLPFSIIQVKFSNFFFNPNFSRKFVNSGFLDNFYAMFGWVSTFGFRLPLYLT